MNPAAILRMLRKAGGEEFTGRMHGYDANTATRDNPAAALDYDNWGQGSTRPWSPAEDAAYDRYVPPGSFDELNAYRRRQTLMRGGPDTNFDRAEAAYERSMSEGAFPGDNPPPRESTIYLNEDYNPSGYPRDWNGAGERLEDVEMGRFDGLSPTDVELSRSRMMGDFDEGPEDEMRRLAIQKAIAGVEEELDDLKRTGRSFYDDYPEYDFDRTGQERDVPWELHQDWKAQYGDDDARILELQSLLRRLRGQQESEGSY